MFLTGSGAGRMSPLLGPCVTYDVAFQNSCIQSSLPLLSVLEDRTRLEIKCKHVEYFLKTDEERYCVLASYSIPLAYL